MMLMICLLTIIFLAGRALAAGPTIPYDSEAQEWLLDWEGLVARNDVLYTTPSVDPWEAMPTGGGDPWL